MERLPEGLVKAVVIGIAAVVVPGFLFGFPSPVLTVGWIVFIAGWYYGLDRVGS